MDGDIKHDKQKITIKVEFNPNNNLWYVYKMNKFLGMTMESSLYAFASTPEEAEARLKEKYKQLIEKGSHTKEVEI